MTYKEMVEMSAALQQAMAIKRADEVKKALRILMDSYGLSKDEMKSYLDGEDSITPVFAQDVDDLTETVVIPEAVANTQTEDEEPLALPESSQEDEVETEVSISPESQEVKIADPKTPMVETEEELPTFDSLLSGDPGYKTFYHPVTPVEKNYRVLPTMDELLSGEPVNTILCLGNLTPKGTAFRQHTRVNHAGGIIPTETATGQTLIYIPPAPSMAA